MALSTTTHTPAPTMQPGPGPGAVQKPDTPGAEPHLIPDTDPFYLMRLYPKAFAGGEAEKEAMAAGKAAHDAGQHAVAAQQVETAPATPEGHAAAPAPERHAGPGPSREA